MKKARIMLVAIAAFGVVGGSLAFKAKSAFGGRKLYTTSIQGAIPVGFTLNATTTNTTTTAPSFTAYYTTAPAVQANSFATIYTTAL